MQSKKKILFLGLLTALIFSSGLMIGVDKARAQFGPIPIPTFETQSVPSMMERVWDKIEKAYTKVQGIIGAQIVDQTVSTYLNQFAYSVATELASGGQGGKPLFSTKSITKSLRSAQDAAFGEFLGELSDKTFAELGLNLCDPSAEKKLTIMLSLLDEAAPPEPECNWRDVQRRWEQFGDQFTADLIKLQLDPRSGSASWNDFFDQFTWEQSDFGVFLTLSDKAYDLKQEAKEALGIEEQQCMGYYSKKTTVSDQIKTHCAAIWATADAAAFIGPMQEVSSISASKQAATQSLGQIIKKAALNFSQTFASKLMKQWIQKGTWSLFARDEGNLRDNLLARLRGGADLYQPIGSDIFKDFTKIEFTRVDDYNFLENFSICPQNQEYRNPDNCVVNSSFVTAATSKKTLKQAIEQGFIDRNTPLISPQDTLRNTSDNCYLDAFCYSNLTKLRKANIIPVGWEMAASRSSQTAPVTIEQAINCFEDELCEFGVSSEWQVDGQDHNPFYHLVDPNWVLKAPSAQCNALVYSDVIEAPGSSDRQQYCADASVCLREDNNGNCLQGQYGYCTKSENIWRTDADVCTDGELYSGCLTFEHETLATNSYLQQTLDYCTADAAGCQRYAQETDSDGNFVLQSIASDSDDLFLNSQASGCRASDAGCSEFIALVPDLDINTIPNASFSDVDGNGAPDGWYSAGIDYDGDRVLNLFTNVSEKIVLLPNTTYILSASAAQDDAGGSGLARIILNTCDVAGNAAGNCSLNSPAGGVDGVGGTCILGQGVSNNIDLQFTPDNTDMQRSYCSFTTNQYVVSANIFVMSGTDAEALWFDDLKLEIASSHSLTPSGYSDYGRGGQIYMTSARFMCTEDEVGCRGYVPDNGGSMVPAVITQADLCPQECVGYATFTQQPNNFDIIEGNNEVEYYNFIPDTGQSCPAQYIGCEEFTNLDEVAQGGEGLEYYTYLRQCVPPSVAGSTYYTWEGSDVSGYQIRTWLILESNLPGGAPCTNIDPGGEVCLDGDIGYPVADCTNPDEDPNCREFFDEAGVSHLRLQDRVIFVSSDCHDYRRSFSGEIYRAIPGFSASCPAQFDGCREYYGNAANNIRELFNDNFEAGTYEPWQGDEIDLSNESLNNNGHSLKTSANDVFSRDIADQTISNHKTYQLSWWMKNDSVVNAIGNRLLVTNSTGQVTIDFPDSSAMHDIAGGNWHYYTTSVYIDLAEDVDSALLLIFDIDGVEDDIFLDNIILREVSDNITVVKGSWETPASCDDPYEGYHLGCSAYADTNGREYNLKSFSRLCREDAIGCIAVIDTHNSTNPYPETFNLGDNSEITVPEDSVTYLVPDTAKYCQPAYKGCQALGLEDRLNPGEFGTIYKINNPDQYGDSLCLAANVYCEEFASDKGPFYFRDPGLESCTYQVNLPVIGDNGIEQNLTGWFRTASLNQEDSEPVGCSDDGDGFYDEPSELDLAADIAATCPADKNLCTGFVDPTDPDQTYYFYDNDKIDEASCKGQVDQNGGCILFHETNNWNADHTAVIDLYDSAASYAQNIAQNQPLSPVSCDPLNPASCDANRLVKVAKDRQCSEWLACKSSVAVEDPPGSGKFRTVCDAVGVCLEYDNENNITHCKRWADESIEPTPLLTQVYQSRATGQNNHIQWADSEYTGYAMPNLLPVEQLSVHDFGTEEDPDQQLVFNSCEIDGICLGSAGNIYHPGCVDSSNGPLATGTACSSEISGQTFNGLCDDSLCWVTPQAGSSDSSGFSLATRGYAAADAPFQTNAYNPSDQNNKYRGANVCEDPAGGCQLDYVKGTYGQGIKVVYREVASLGIPRSICTSGDTTMQDCLSNADCDSGLNQGDGICSVLTKEETFSNWAGICLETDRTYRLLDEDDVDGGERYYCNQWYPTDKITGVDSLYDNYQTAGYYNPDDLLFCAVGQPFVIPEDRYYCGGIIETPGMNYCSVLIKVPAGTRVNVDAVAGFGQALANSYLNGGIYKFYNQNGASPDGSSLQMLNIGSDNYSDGFGVDLIMRWANNSQPPNQAGGNYCHWQGLLDDQGGDSLFSQEDFNAGILLPIDVMQIRTLFDAPDAEHQIEYYYYDQQVRPNGDTNWGKGIKTPRHSVDFYNPFFCSDTSCEAIPNCDTIAHGTHEARHYEKYWSASFCNDGHPRARWKVCNPLPFNYYVKAARPSGAYLCQQSDCSDSQNKGLGCSQDQTTYASMLDDVSGLYSWTRAVGDPARPISSIANMPAGDDSLCYNNPNCRFIHCLENINTSAVDTMNANGNPIDDNIYTSATAAPNVTYCTEYGDIVTTINDNGDITNINITECYNRIYVSTDNLTFNEIVGTDPGDGSILTVDPDLLDESFDIGTDDLNSADCLQSDQASGCVPILNAMTEHNSGVPYEVQTIGTQCDLVSDLDCYQQCSTVSLVSSGSTSSGVRTDIWWREGRNAIDTDPNNDRITPAWDSWYYDSTQNYGQHDDVTFDRVGNLVDNLTSPYGSAEGPLSSGPAISRVPITGSPLSALTSVNFYSITNFAAADDQMAYLFGRVYNFVWNVNTDVYEADDYHDIANQAQGLVNPLAGPDYDPRLIQVCGDRPCQNGPAYFEGFSVNNATSTDLLGDDGSLFVALKFYYHAHPDHMPITDIIVDWGDGGISSNPGKYKNNLFNCDPEEDMPGRVGSAQGFGGTPGACSESYRVFYNTYQLGEANCGDGSNDSCYTPIVTIIDNWGNTGEYEFDGEIRIIND